MAYFLCCFSIYQQIIFPLNDIVPSMGFLLKTCFKHSYVLGITKSASGHLASFCTTVRLVCFPLFREWRVLRGVMESNTRSPPPNALSLEPRAHPTPHPWCPTAPYTPHTPRPWGPTPPVQ